MMFGRASLIPNLISLTTKSSSNGRPPCGWGFCVTKGVTMKNMDNSMRLVPFGKYKGQPVEVMQMDTGYCEWLSTQDWFRERYANVYQQVIINNFTEASETPEHNKLQMLFLDKEFYKKIEAALPVDPFKLFHPQILDAVSEIRTQVKSDENYFKKGGLQTDINSNILQIGIDGSPVDILLSKTPQKILFNGTPVLDRGLNVRYTILPAGAQSLVGKENTTYAINVYYSFTAI